jgi:hypothetical protein
VQRHRTIAGPPVRTATAAWEVLVGLITDTLIVSDEVSAVGVAGALAPLHGIGPALIAAGHLESSPVVLVSGALHVGITVATGTATTSMEENLNPVGGGRSAGAEWRLHLPSPVALATVVAAAAEKSAHLSVEPAPDGDTPTDGSTSEKGLVDLAALGKLRAST